MMDNIADLPPPDKASALRWKSGLIAASCAALGVSRASLHRRIALQKNPRLPRLRPRPRRALSQSETDAILDILRSARFADQAPAEIYASLLDEGRYLCSIRTMYRILAGQNEVRERRRVLRHMAYEKPELLATGPNQVWTWDITKRQFNSEVPQGAGIR